MSAASSYCPRHFFSSRGPIPYVVRDAATAIGCVVICGTADRFGLSCIADARLISDGGLNSLHGIKIKLIGKLRCFHIFEKLVLSAKLLFLQEPDSNVQSLKHPAGITFTPFFVVYAIGAFPHIMINCSGSRYTTPGCS